MIYLILSIAAVCVVCVWTIEIIAIVMRWQKDCKEYGKEHLAVSLWERLRAFAICFVIPVIVGLLIGMLQMK